MRVAVVGSGPAGFYAAGALLSADPPAEVDMIERLPTPWGLVRLGVAPDHPKLKTVSRAFERIAAQPGFRFLGNVEVGRDLHHDDLVRRLRDPDDRRSVLVELTEKGRETHEQGMGIQAEKEALLAEALTDREKEQLNALLRRVMLTLEDRYPGKHD